MRSNRLLQPVVDIPNSASYYQSTNPNPKESNYTIDENYSTMSPYFTNPQGKVPNSNLIQESRNSLKSKKKDLPKPLSP